MFTQRCPLDIKFTAEVRKGQKSFLMKIEIPFFFFLPRKMGILSLIIKHVVDPLLGQLSTMIRREMPDNC